VKHLSLTPEPPIENAERLHTISKLLPQLNLSEILQRSKVHFPLQHPKRPVAENRETAR
jgi:hypothetical protein